MTNQQPTGEGVNILHATDKKSYIGKAFQVNDVKVEKKPGSHALWISQNNGTPMLLALSNGGNAGNANVGQGDRIDVTGTVEKAPPEGRAQHEWSLSSGGAKRLEQEGAYVQATQVHRVDQSGNQNG